MASKFDRLRAGEVVEIEPGRKGRLNSQKKTFETSDGRTVYVGEDPDFFPKDENQLKLSREKENLERDIKKTPAGEFLFQAGSTGSLAGVKDWGNRLTMKGDDYLRNKQAQQQVSQSVSKRSPWTSAAGTVAGFVPDIALTKGMSAAKAAPLIAGVSAGSRVLDEPGEVAKEAAVSSGMGFILDKGVNWLNKATQRRAAGRDIANQGQNVAKANIAREAEVEASNLKGKEAFRKESDWANRENSARQHQYNLELTDRKNQMIKSQQAHAKAEAAHSSNVNALKEKARADQKAYEEAVKKLPQVQKEAQQEFSRGVMKNVGEIESSFPKNSRIYTDQLGVNQFIDESINSTGLAGSAEGSQASRILKTLFPEGEILTSKELAKRYQAIEEAIQRGKPEVQRVLSEFKQYLGDRLPSVLEDTVAYEKIIPSLEKTLEKEIASVLKQMPLGTSGSTITELAKSNLKSALRDISPDQFVQKLQSGELSQFIKDRILTIEDLFSEVGGPGASGMKKKDFGIYESLKNHVGKQHSFFVSEMGNKIDNAIARSEIKATSAAGEAGWNLKQKVKGTYGMAEPVQLPSPPEPLNIPKGPTAPGELPFPNKPSMVESPMAPMPQKAVPLQNPMLPPAQGSAEAAGDFLEKPLLQGKGMNSLLKLGALKYALGPAALPIEAGAAAAYGAGKVLTSPGTAGEVARMSFKQGGIQAIEMLAQKYPSYHDGVLEDPRERRSLTKEIENDPEIPLEQKAMMQSKINRGRPLNLPLQ